MRISFKRILCLELVATMLPIILSLVTVTATSSATPAEGTEPAEIRIPDINVIAYVVPIRIVNGTMLSPTNLAWAGWYEELFKIGEPGNAVFTGYYDWQGLPSLFHDLGSLKSGDEIEIVGRNGVLYHYEVVGVQRFDKDTAPLRVIVSETEFEAVTIITDAPPLDSTSGNYVQSTVVRAKRVNGPED
jgi:sortase (surface protein transpeptidase)